LPQLGEVQFLVGRALVVAAIHLLGCLVVDPFLGHCLSFPLTPSCVTCGRASPHDGAAPKDTQEETRERAWGRLKRTRCRSGLDGVTHHHGSSCRGCESRHPLEGLTHTLPRRYLRTYLSVRQCQPHRARRPVRRKSSAAMEPSRSENSAISASIRRRTRRACAESPKTASSANSPRSNVSSGS